MIRNLFLYMLPAFLVLTAGCGGDSTEAAPERKTLPVPDITFSVSDLTAIVRWSVSTQVEAVRFTFELYAGGASAPEKTATTSLTSQRFALEAGVTYRFRVCAVAPLGSSEWQDSAFSEEVTFTAGRLSAPLSVRAGDTQVCHTTTHSAADAFDAVLKYAGASLSRDAVDKRAESDARSGEATFPNGGNGSTGGIIDTQSAVGGWPELTATDEEIRRAATDTDGDGIPDYYETLLGLDPNDASDANATTLDPQGIYPNIEVYFHFLVREISAAQTAGGTYTALE